MKNKSPGIGDIVFKYIPQEVKGKPFLGVMYYSLKDIDGALFEIGEYDYHYVNGDVFEAGNPSSKHKLYPYKSYINTNTYLYKACVFKADTNIWVGDFSM